jgi:Flp pilus assembly protein TadG
MNLLRRIVRRREAGQALAEFALIAPLLFILIFGIVDMTRAYNAWVTIQGAAREGARYGVTGQTTCAGGPATRVGCIDHVAKEHTNSLTNNESTVTVSVRNWQYPDYANPAVQGNPGDQCDALEVRVDYEFEPATPLIGSLIGGVTMTARERMVNEPYGICE